MTGEELEKYIAIYHRSVWSVALSYVKNPSDADDIAQDVFFKLYTYNKSFDSDEHLKAWLIRCTVNRSKNILRSYWHRFSEPLEKADSIEYNDAKERDAAISSALFMKLSKSNRVVVYLHYYEGYSIAEISHLLGISETAVSTRLMRGRNRLKQLLTDERNENNGLQTDR